MVSVNAGGDFHLSAYHFARFYIDFAFYVIYNKIGKLYA